VALGQWPKDGIQSKGKNAKKDLVDKVCLHIKEKFLSKGVKKKMGNSLGRETAFSHDGSTARRGGKESKRPRLRTRDKKIRRKRIGHGGSEGTGRKQKEEAAL